MSKIQTVETLEVTSLPALRLAVGELNKQGIQCSLMENHAPRMYSEGQIQRELGWTTDKAPVALVLPSCNYDVGFEKREGGRLVPFFDHMGSGPRRELESHWKGRAHPLGKLATAYTKQATILAARAKGFRVRSAQTNAETGQVKLTLTKN